MFQKFFENTIESKYIQSLLYNTYLPLYKTIKVGDIVQNNTLYIYKNAVIRTSGSDGVFEFDGSNYDNVSEYQFGKHYNKFTDNYLSTVDYYDSDLHIRLGEYLRCIRDIRGIDLMPFYNCFTYKMTGIKGNILTKEGLRCGQSVVCGQHTVSDNEYKQGTDSSIVYLIPVRFNQKYTIAIDSTVPYSLEPIIVKNKIIDRLSERLSNNKIIINYSRFNNPSIYSVDTDDIELLDNEKYLFIALNVSKQINSSIVILEGDYSQTSDTTPIINFGDGVVTDVDMNNCLISNLSLLQFNLKESYAFSDRLIEYLTSNVITSNEYIMNNIKRTQDNLNETLSKFAKQKEQYKQKYYQDIWDSELRNRLYKTYMDNSVKFSKFDINGFVDKSIEDFILSNANKNRISGV